MGSIGAEKPHLVCIPYPAQGHISPMLQLAKLLHYKGFHITFVNTEFNHQRLVRSRGPDSVKGLEDFRFETIPDGLPTLDQDRTQDIPSLCVSISKNCHLPFLNLLKRLNSTPNIPPVTCIISDGAMGFNSSAAQELHIPRYVLYTPSACGLVGYLHYPELIDKGYVPLKDESCLTNGYLKTQVDFIPGIQGVRLKDLPSFIRTTNPEDPMINYDLDNGKKALKSRAIILNTFDDLEHNVLDGMRTKFSLNLFSIGPMAVLNQQISHSSPSKSIGSNLWREDSTCLDWLDSRDTNSVLYVNFGSITVMTVDQTREFAWGLANSGHSFLWVIRPDLVSGDSAVVPNGFVEATRGRCMIASWCAQEQVLAHPSVGGFLTHCGWNSTLESLSAGVPMICWPFFAEQPMNCRFACSEWGVGVEIGGEVTREQVERVVRMVMEGEKGREMRNKAFDWKERAAKATKEGGSSYENLESLVHELRRCKYE